MAAPGILYVTMQPKPGLPLEQFHEWYNNEHGPTRLRLPQIFANGLRYRAIDGQEPKFLASYDITSMPLLETETYTNLRANRSPREAETIGQVDVKRYFWDLVSAKQSPLFLPIEELTDEEAEGLVLVAAEINFKDTADAAEAEAEVRKWYEEDHVEMISKIPGWLRSRLFRTSSLETAGQPPSFLVLSEYAKENGLDGEEHKAARSTPRTKETFSKYADTPSMRRYSLFYVFGPAPRDLENLSRLEASKSAFRAGDGKTLTTNDPAPSISSYVTTKDGLSIPYLLEGNPDPRAPTVAFCNSLLTSLHMWDPFVAILRAQRPQYRLLRYDARGRHAVPQPPAPATLDMLADDLAQVLDALRIPALHALVGVSQGGATALKFALRHPARLARFVACDFNAASSAANTSAWRERIAIAEGSPGISELAAQTVARWFHPANTAAARPDLVRWMTDMVAANDVEGFRYGCQALWDYDMRGAPMRGCAVPGLLVAGEADGKGALVRAMDAFRADLGPRDGGAELAIVPDAGHLPMCENPEGFWKAIEKFL
ncbi:hypothetical protein SLS62_005439 [Diatrype stigma]|uniref:AB hydrolase-1 domain-containing protein n=1 Tax=Diatrype stigma TaxID=117547 RepID=A0AAN9UPS8_9PEZI